MAGVQEKRSTRQLELLRRILFNSDLQAYQRLSSQLNHAGPNERPIWLLPHTTLSLIDFILREYHGEIIDGEFLDIEGLINGQKEFSAQSFYDLIRAYFAIERERGQKVLVGMVRMKTDELVYRHFVERIGTYELERIDNELIHFVEFLKSIDFFSFLEKQYPNELRDFIERRRIDSWERYVVQVVDFLSAFWYNPDNYISRVKVEENLWPYFNSFSSHESYKVQKPNLRNLKEYPLLKYQEGGFLMIYRTFLFEKIHKALFFEFQTIAGTDIKSTIGKKFFEEKLCNKYISKIFGVKKVINIPGVDKRFEMIEGEPDHYARLWNNVFVFEAKDTLITDHAKTSMDNETVMKEIETKLVWKISNGKKKRSGVSQLVNFISNFENQFMHFDPAAKLGNITFYPVLIVQDRVLSTMGINEILNDYFDDQLTLEIRSKKKIRPLVVMNIDSLILYSIFFAGNPKVFKNCLDDYIKYSRRSSTCFSFDTWMRRKFLGKDKKKQEAFLTHISETGNLKFTQFNNGDLAAFRE
jgi:hypothetical protein